MAISRDFAAFVEELLLPLGRVSVKSMFGGGGVYRDGVMFGLIADDLLYLKADEATCQPYVQEGMGPFVYRGKAKPITMPYWQIPERLYDEADELESWARRAFDVALAAKKVPATKKATSKRGKKG